MDEQSSIQVQTQAQVQSVLRPRVLFILKHRDVYYANEKDCSKPLSSGLLNSATQVERMLSASNIDSKLVSVVDNNKIDAEVHKYRPTHVIIEALWVVPEKFEILQKLHPTVKWYIRLHSEVPFIANEGIAMDWLFRYLQYKNVFIGINSRRMLRDIKAIVPENYLSKLEYQPNYYWNEQVDSEERTSFKDGYYHIGCFGAIRPLKNQLAQAIAAVEFARQTGRKLKFHINSSRVENNGDNIVKNLRGLFTGLDSENYILVEHPWLEHAEFVKLIASMDICMQVSFTETFNIVTADAVCNNVPVLVSSDIDWVFPLFNVNSHSSNSILYGLKICTSFIGRLLKIFNRICLTIYNEKAKLAWLKNGLKPL